MIKAFTQDLPSRGADPDQIDVVCCDMRDPYWNGIGKGLKRARVVFDRFHVMNQLNKAIERVRNFLDARVTNGMVEGLNSKIKTAMKRAYGFKQIGYLRTIMYLVAGRLTFNCP